MNFAGQTDPYPYVIGAYILGFIGIYGYALYLFASSKRLKDILTVMKEESRNDKKEEI